MNASVRYRSAGRARGVRPAAAVAPSYFLYGVHLRSCWELPYAGSAREIPPDVELLHAPAGYFERARRSAISEPGEENWLKRATLQDQSTYLCWLHLYEFIVSADGRRILSHLPPSVSYESFLVYLLNGALPFALLEMGLDPLHASVVAVDGRAIGFLGKSGYGKSTLAGSFLDLGCPVLTDDALVLKRGHRTWLAYPGPPRLKLHPESAAAVVHDDISGVPMNPLTSKLIIPLRPQQSQQTPFPIAALYVLGRSKRLEKAALHQIRIQRITGRRALMALLKNSYNDWFNSPGRLQTQLLQYAEIASQVPVKLLSYPRVFDALPGVRQRILTDL